MFFALPYKHSPFVCFERSTTSCNCRMTTLKNKAQYDDVLCLMQRLCVDSAYPPPDRVSYNILIDALGKASRLEFMELAYRSMVMSGFLPDVRTFTSMLHAYVRGRHGVAVLDTLDAMKRRGIRPNVCTYTVVEQWLFGTISSPSVFVGSVVEEAVEEVSDRVRLGIEGDPCCTHRYCAEVGK